MTVMDKAPADMGGDDSAAYEALASELAEDMGGAPPVEEKPAAEAKAPAKEAESEDDAGGQPQPKLTYEEMEKRYRQQGGALKEARERERAAAEQIRAWNAAVEEMRASRQAAKPAEKQPEPEKEIDPYEDPIGYVQAELAKVRAEIQGTSQQTKEIREADAARAEYQQFMGVVERAENAFKATTPDYHDAAEFLEKSRRNELSLLYPDHPQMDAYARQNGYRNAAQLREAIFQNDAQTVARTALQAGMNPAEAYYNLAKGRGYVTKAAGENAPAKKAEAALDAVRRGQKASKTISGGSGNADAPVGVKDLAELYAEDPEAFDREWDRLAKAGKLG
jgi:hypothetical protein